MNRHIIPSLALIISTVADDIDPTVYLNTLRPNGILCHVGIPPSPITFHSATLIGGQKSVAGSAIGGRATMREMLDFSARHGIRTLSETVPMKQANEAIDRVMANKVRYRIVLAN